MLEAMQREWRMPPLSGLSRLQFVLRNMESVKWFSNLFFMSVTRPRDRYDLYAGAVTVNDVFTMR